MSAHSSPLGLVTCIKALAAQFIVWHHLALYGPMSDRVGPYAARLLDWLEDYGRLAVQAFLVVGGFLAARALRLDVPVARATPPWATIVGRYWRLVMPYLFVLPLAIAAAAFARHLIDEPSIPAPPTWTQVLAHVFLLQDILGMEALSAGVWYIAIAFQLHVTLVLMQWLAGRHVLMVCLAMTAASLLWFNRQAELDEWAAYFFGSYGLGILAQWVAVQPRRLGGVLLLMTLAAAALALEWRSRIAIAALVALGLAITGGRLRLPSRPGRLLAFLDHHSYALFLVHYPVCLACGALVFRLWPESPALNALGIVLAWLASLAAAVALQRAVDART